MYRMCVESKNRKLLGKYTKFYLLTVQHVNKISTFRNTLFEKLYLSCSVFLFLYFERKENEYGFTDKDDENKSTKVNNFELFSIKIYNAPS